MDGPVHANNGNNGGGGNARRGTATEFSYMLQREGSTDSVEAHAFDDINNLIKNDSISGSVVGGAAGGGGGVGHGSVGGGHGGGSGYKDSLSSLPQAAFNYINSIVGSGVIGIPYAFHKAGFGVGLLLLAFVAVITDYSLILMVRCGHMSGRFSYPGIMEAAYGKWGYYLLSALQFMYPFLAMISYNVVVGDTLSKVMVRIVPSWSASMGVVRFMVVFFVTAFVITPLCLHKNISRLARASFLSLLCVVVILFAVICRMFSDTYDVVPRSDDDWQFANTDLIPATGVMAFAFMCHHNTFLVYQSMRDASLERWEKVTHISLGFAWAVAALFGIAGYSTFRALSQGDLLENYCWSDDLMNFSRVVFSFSILLTYPFECFVSREIVKTQLNRWQNHEPIDYDKEMDPSQQTEDHDKHSVPITLSIIFVAFIVSPMTECLGSVLELNGLLAAIPLAYVLPGLAFIQLEPHSLFSREKLPALGLVIFGIIFTIAGVSVLIPDLAGDCKSNIVMGYCQNETEEVGEMTTKGLIAALTTLATPARKGLGRYLNHIKYTHELRQEEEKDKGLWVEE